MENITIPIVLKFDNFGRLTLPKEFREKLASKEVSLEWEVDHICLRRVPTWHELIGTAPGLDMDAFMKERHEERK